MLLTRDEVEKWRKFSFFYLSFFGLKFKGSSVNMCGINYGRGRLTINFGRRAFWLMRSEDVDIKDEMVIK